MNDAASHPVLTADELQSVEERWKQFTLDFAYRFDKTPTPDSALFIIGLEERYTDKVLEKEEKQSVIAEGLYKVLALQGYFLRDANGLWTPAKPLPVLNDKQQEVFYQYAVLQYLNQ
ncbi:MAG: hypothetical protein IAF08_16860 [Rhizobacter sp.]|nr:hypothetical protein [Chlorobiales bacterium]